MRKNSRERETCVYLSLYFLSLSTLYIVILSWFVDVEVANSSVAGDKIVEENDIEVRPEKISVSCLDENVCLESCRKYCSQVAWSVLMVVVDVLNENPIWYCVRCTNPIHDESQASVVCVYCLNWYDFTCLDMKNPPKSKLCICRKCYD